MGLVLQASHDHVSSGGRLRLKPMTKYVAASGGLPFVGIQRHRVQIVKLISVGKPLTFGRLHLLVISP